jgi:transposase
MRPTDMAAMHSDEFKRDAVRIAPTSGLTQRQVASDLGIGRSTLGKWVRAVSEEAKVPAQDAELLRENERLRKENRILRDLSRNKKRSGGGCFPANVGGSKKVAMFFAAQKP